MKRNLQTNILAGVIAGLADYTGQDVSILRIASVLLAICSLGTAVFVYLLAAIIVPPA